MLKHPFARLADIQVRCVRHNCWGPGARRRSCTRSRRWRCFWGLAAGARIQASLPGAPDHAVARAVLRHGHAHCTCNTSLRMETCSQHISIRLAEPYSEARNDQAQTRAGVLSLT